MTDLTRVALCFMDTVVSISDFQFWKALKPLLEFKDTNGHKVSNPHNFKVPPMLTPFGHSYGVWRFLEKASKTDTGVRQAELEHPSLQKFKISVQAGSRFMFTLLFIEH